jgi:hypothetical protein
MVTDASVRKWREILRMRKYIQVVVLFLLVASSAFGATISYSVVVNNGGLNYIAGSGGTFDLAKFDPSYGTLLSVTFALTANSYGGYNRVDNESANVGRATVQIGSSVEVDGPSSLTVIALPYQQSSSVLSADNDAAPDFIGTDAVGITGTTATDSRSNLLNVPADMLPYIGSGQITYSFSSFAQQSVSAQSPLSLSDLAFSTANPTFNFTGTVTYEYDGPGPSQTPEPGTIGLAVVLGSLGLSRLRRRHSD